MKIKSQDYLKGWAVVVLSFFITSRSASCNQDGYSAVRYPNESFIEAELRVNSKHMKRQAFYEEWPYYLRPYYLRQPIDSVNFTALANWSYNELKQGFMSGRDSRIITMEGSHLKKRRISWLYPYDGCFIRADLLGRMLEYYGYPQTKKLFVFGDLTVNTPYVYGGTVRWWFHVVIVASVDNQVYVFDPALYAEDPITLEYWINLIDNSFSNLTYTLCDSKTFLPSDRCSEPSSHSLPELLQIAKNFLYNEYYSLKSLGYNPDTELSDQPPWRKKINAFCDLTEPKIFDIAYIFNNNTNLVEYYQFYPIDVDTPIEEKKPEENPDWVLLGTSFSENFVQKLHSDQDNLHAGNILACTKSILGRGDYNHTITFYYKFLHPCIYGSCNLERDKPNPIESPEQSFLVTVNCLELTEADSPYAEFLGTDYPETFEYFDPLMKTAFPFENRDLDDKASISSEINIRVPCGAIDIQSVTSPITAVDTQNPTSPTTIGTQNAAPSTASTLSPAISYILELSILYALFY